MKIVPLTVLVTVMYGAVCLAQNIPQCSPVTPAVRCHNLQRGLRAFDTNARSRLCSVRCYNVLSDADGNFRKGNERTRFMCQSGFEDVSRNSSNPRDCVTVLPASTDQNVLQPTPAAVTEEGESSVESEEVEEAVPSPSASTTSTSVATARPTPTTAPPSLPKCSSEHRRKKSDFIVGSSTCEVMCTIRKAIYGIPYGNPIPKTRYSCCSGYKQERAYPNSTFNRQDRCVSSSQQRG